MRFTVTFNVSEHNVTALWIESSVEKSDISVNFFTIGLVNSAGTKVKLREKI